MTNVSPQSPTYFFEIDGILQGHKWSSTTLTYSFPSNSSTYYSSYSLTDDPWIEPYRGFAPLNSTQQIAARNIFDLLESYTMLTFTQDPTPDTPATLRLAETNEFSYINDHNTAWTWPPDTDNRGGDIWFSHVPQNSYDRYGNPIIGNYAFHTFLHEIGHALGLAGSRPS